MSLLYTMQGLDPSFFEPVVVLIRPNQVLIDFYEGEGFRVVLAPGIRTFEHTTASWARFSAPFDCLSFITNLFHWGRSKRLTQEIVRQEKPDIIHLNSVVLVPSAIALSKNNIPFVWHVREAPVKGYFGIRTAFLRSMLKKCADEIIFISQHDHEQWVDKMRGGVIANFVDQMKFYPNYSPAGIKTLVQVPDNSKMILFLGGISKINGLSVLLKAINIVRREIPSVICISAGDDLSSSGRLISRVARAILPLCGLGVPAQNILKQVNDLKIQTHIRFLPFQTDIRPFFARSDVVVFPATVPHFARPIVEAAAMAKPAIGSDLGGINELIEHRKTGLLVETGSPEALAEAIVEVLTTPELAESLGQNALAKATREFNFKKQIARISDIYESILQKG